VAVTPPSWTRLVSSSMKNSTYSRCRQLLSAVKQVAGRGRRAAHTEPQQLTLDALVAPARVLRGQPDDQLLHLRVQRRPTGLKVWVGPAAGDQAPMPAQQRSRVTKNHDQRADASRTFFDV